MTIYVEIIHTSFESKGTILHFVRNIMRRHWSMNDSPSNTCMAKFSTIPKQARMSSLIMRVKHGMMPLLFTVSQFAVRDCCNLIHLIGSLQARCRKSWLITKGLTSVSSKFAAVNKAFLVTQIKILTR